MKEDNKINYIYLEINKSLDFINDNIYNKITLDDISNYLNISKYYFCRIFKECMGITPYKYLLNKKIEKVKEDLDLNLDVDINTIVNNYNFYDVSHLNKSFSKIYGVTPLEYKKSIKWTNECIIK